MASETQTLALVVAAIAADPRLDTPREKCSVMRNLALREYISREQYASANGAACGGYAIDAYPWSANVAAAPAD